MAPWENIARKAQEHRDRTVDAVEPLLPTIPPPTLHNVIDVPRKVLSREEVKITELPVVELIQELAAGRLSAVTVVSAFLRRSAVAQKLVNCIFELLPEQAIARARELDELHKRGGPLGPLHGVPISLKALIAKKGSPQSSGFVGEYENICDDDAEILKILWRAGAIFYARTTEPQGVMMLETISYLTGVTTNPHNTATTCGGSTGGEAALEALGGSPLGIGGDIGGSVRSPAGNCGTWALRPTTNRLPIHGLSHYMAPNEAISATLGPMCPTFDGLNLIMKIVLDSEPWKEDLSLHQIPWRDPKSFFTGEKGEVHVNVGVLWDDGVVKPTAPVTRALTEVVERLRSLDGFTVTEWQPYQHERGMKILEKLYAPDGGRKTLEACEKTGEPLHELLAYRMVNGPGVEDQSIHTLWEWVTQREVYRYQYLQEWLSKAPQMDVILCPHLQTPAPLLGTTRYWGYTSIWNLLDYPAAVFPVTRLDPKLDVEAAHEPRNEADAWCREHYDAFKQRDAPVNLQLVGKRMDDEKVMGALEIIKNALNLPFVNCLAGLSTV